MHLKVSLSYGLVTETTTYVKLSVSVHTVQNVPYRPMGHFFPVTVPSSPKCPSFLPDPPLQKENAI